MPNTTETHTLEQSARKVEHSVKLLNTITQKSPVDEISTIATKICDVFDDCTSNLITGKNI